MPDACRLIQASIQALQTRICINNEETEDLVQRCYDLDAAFTLYDRDSDLGSIFDLGDELARLDNEHGTLVTRLNALYAELEDMQ